MTVHGHACAFGLTLGLAATVAAAAGAPTDSDSVRYVEGKASASDGHLMYTESHWIYDDGSPQAPDFELDDARTGYREGVRSSGGKRVIFVRNDKNAAERTAALDTSPMPVIDAGFDAYIRTHWDTLGKSGDTLPFLLPSRLGTLSFRVKRQGDTQIDGHAARQYRLSLDSMIGFALPHLDVAYDAKTHELLSFSGIANIRSSDGKNVDAKILFDPSKNKDVSRTDLDNAAKAPLNGQCKIP